MNKKINGIAGLGDPTILRFFQIQEPIKTKYYIATNYLLSLKVMLHSFLKNTTRKYKPIDSFKRPTRAYNEASKLLDPLRNFQITC